MPRAEGPFEVSITPLAPDPSNPQAHGRMVLDKRYRGALEASARGEMLAVRSPDGASGVYVAMERVTGSLDGREGEFALAHRGVMDGGTQELLITVVPGSGTGALAGLKGELRISIAPDGAHAYQLDYELPG